MLNIINLAGESKSGKSATIPLLTASKKTDLPFNTPDLDWYTEAHLSGGMSLDCTSKLCSVYMMTHAWYSHLGRHINLKERDYHSFQSLKKYDDINIRMDRLDNDVEFEKFLKKHDNKNEISIFCWDVLPAIYENITKNYPIQMSQIYCHRSPYGMVSQWLSGNRVVRSKALSRMFKFSSVENWKTDKLLGQYKKTNNVNESQEINKRYEFSDIKVNDYNISQMEILAISEMIKKQKNSAEYWAKYGVVSNFEKIVTDPYKLVAETEIFQKLEISNKNLNSAVDFIGLRKIDSILERNLEKIRNSLFLITNDNEFVNMVVDEQLCYLDTYF